jgi:hypothetical protein
MLHDSRLREGKCARRGGATFFLTSLGCAPLSRNAPADVPRCRARDAKEKPVNDA